MIGDKVISMATLTDLFLSFGFRKVRTYTASGNVLFKTEVTNRRTVTAKIEAGLKNSLGYEVSVFLRTIPELKALLELNLFRQEKAGINTKACVTFLREPPRLKTKLPFLPTN